MQVPVLRESNIQSASEAVSQSRPSQGRRKKSISARENQPHHKASLRSSLTQKVVIGYRPSRTFVVEEKDEQAKSDIFEQADNVNEPNFEKSAPQEGFTGSFLASSDH